MKHVWARHIKAVVQAVERLGVGLVFGGRSVAEGFVVQFQLGHVLVQYIPVDCDECNLYVAEWFIVFIEAREPSLRICEGVKVDVGFSRLAAQSAFVVTDRFIVAVCEFDGPAVCRKPAFYWWINFVLCASDG
eukprot:4174285-Pleurochrysis_carterae.AAC.1